MLPTIAPVDSAPAVVPGTAEAETVDSAPIEASEAVLKELVGAIDTS